MAKEKIFANGMYFDKKEGSPVYVIGSLALKVSEVIPFLQLHEKVSGYVNIDIKQAKGGKYYCELNTWVPKESSVTEEEDNQARLNNLDTANTGDTDTLEYPEEDINNEDIPF